VGTRVDELSPAIDADDSGERRLRGEGVDLV